MVSDNVNVLSRAAENDEINLWTSNGKENYTIEKAKKEKRGTCITLNIKKDADEFLDSFRLRSIITKYSNYIPFPIYLKDLDDKEKKKKKKGRPILGKKKKKKKKKK